MVYLQDLGFRLYLVGSHRDRQILHHVCLSATQKDIDWGKHIRVESPEDSRVIAEAFFNLYLVSQRSVDTKALPIDFMAHLAGFVLHITGWTPELTADEVIDVAYAALQFLWLLLEHRVRILAADQHKVRLCASYVFGFFGHLQNKRISTKQEQTRLAGMLAQAEIVALAGRVLLLVLEEGGEFQGLELLNEAISGTAELEASLSKSVAIAPELFLDSKLEWAKVYAQFRTFAEMRWPTLSEDRLRYLAVSCQMWQEHMALSLKPGRMNLEVLALNVMNKSDYRDFPVVLFAAARVK
ncbi:hypothetical protein FRC09_001118 [Ceratobasidium sp. 395]|nr:hypothetical protein FRC09_001118 [Ceratobasidium sp. 395]